MPTPTATDHHLSLSSPIVLPMASALWTLFVWGTRARNIVNDDTLNAGERVLAFTVTAAFVIGALATIIAVASGWDRLRSLLAVVATFTIGWWLIRSALILGHDHSVGFRVVHLILAVISGVLAAAAWRAQPASPME